MKKSLELPQVLVLVALVLAIVTIIPALLNAQNDVSIGIGIMAVVAVFYGVFKYGKQLLAIVGISLDDEIGKPDEQKED